MVKHLFLITNLLICVGANGQYLHDSLKVDDGYIHYYLKGEGDPIVLLQGGPGFSSYYMRAISDSLETYKNILIDFQGTGRSQYRNPDSSWVSPDHIVNDIEIVRNHLGIEKWIVLGHSWATHFALYYAIKYPRHVSKIILLGTAGTDNTFQQYLGDNVRLRLTKDDIDALQLLAKDTSATGLDRFRVFLNGYFYDRTKSSAFLNAVPRAEISHFYNGRFFSAFVRHPSYRTFDIAQHAYALKHPVRIIQGRQDPGGIGIQEQLNERLKNSKIFYTEQSGHFPWLEKPGDFFKYLRESLND